jgi:outer membrane protein OmpA-like peptidoglycan-associated protein
MVNKIRDYIVSKGVLPETLKLAYYGEVNFIADNSTPQGRAKNRRVEFKFVGDTLNEKKTEGK